MVVVGACGAGRGYAAGWWRGIGFDSSFESASLHDYSYYALFALVGAAAHFYGDNALAHVLVLAACVFVPLAALAFADALGLRAPS